uniref:Uncharacterized protein n=1 Tax=Klebsiella pneumoniae TaxID=573 RepID=A0A385FZY3_KLEPN|nr:hypothetical protein [Klebsiella pneumoniae]
MSYAHLFENCDHVIEGNILLDIASIPPVLKKALIFLIQSGLEREAFNAQLTELLIWGARRIRKKSYAKVFRASVRAETSRLPVCGSAARRNRRLG